MKMLHGSAYPDLFAKKKVKKSFRLENSITENTNTEEYFTPDETLILLGEQIVKVDPPGVSDIPAGYTYLGQFIDHDMTQTKGSDDMANTYQTANGQTNQTTSSLDLSSVYSQGDMTKQIACDTNTGKLLLDSVSGCNPNQRDCFWDLPRDEDKKAKIPDKRNDENLLIAQLHVQFIRLHNAIVDKLIKSSPRLSKQERFERARTEVIASYQKIVVSDFLYRLLNEDVWRLYFGTKLSNNSQKSLQQKLLSNALFDLAIPIEFSAAAFRFGHALVRKNYVLNSISGSVKLGELFGWTGRGGKIKEEQQLPFNRVVNWLSFFTALDGGIAQRTNAVQPGINIKLPGCTGNSANLAIRNLVRGQSFNLCSGQELYQYLFDRPYFCETDKKELEQIVPALSNNQLNPNVKFKNSRILKPILSDPVDSVIAEKVQTNTPLLYYFLCEMASSVDFIGNQQQTKIGPLCSFVIADTFSRILSKKGNTNSPRKVFKIESMRELIKITQPKEI